MMIEFIRKCVCSCMEENKCELYVGKFKKKLSLSPPYQRELNINGSHLIHNTEIGDRLSEIENCEK